jgi:uncharacterized protein
VSTNIDVKEDLMRMAFRNTKEFWWVSVLLLLPVITLSVLTTTTSYAQNANALPRKVVMGAQLLPATGEERTAAKISANSALKIGRVAPDLTADKIGLKADDVIVSVDERALQTTAELADYIATRKAGEAVKVMIARGGNTLSLNGTWAERAREASNAVYNVEYAHVASTMGSRMRTIVTAPPKAGKHPALLFIQGVTLSSVDFPLAASENNSYARIVRSFAERGYVTMRVDKPGVGDSEGGPGTSVGFLRELDAYRQALKALIARGDVDPDRVIIFGHSMGGLWGPMLATETKIAATIVSGTTFRTWVEYSLENTRRQSALAGATVVDIDREIKLRSALFHYYFNDRMNPDAIAKQYPSLANLVKEDFPDINTWAGRSHGFWREVNDVNLPETWEKASGKVLALWGESEFISGEIDHTMLEAWVNKLRPGTAKYVRVPQSDHGFSLTTSPADSLGKWGKPEAKFNPNVIQMTHDWLADALSWAKR